MYREGYKYTGPQMAVDPRPLWLLPDADSGLPRRATPTNSLNPACRVLQCRVPAAILW